MAKIEIESAFVEAWTKNNEQHPDWALKTAEPHRRKNEVTDQWETVGRTFRTVKAAYGVEIDFSQYRKGDRIQVWGKEVTEVREHEGKKFYDLVVKADRVELVGERAGGGSGAVSDGSGATTPPAGFGLSQGESGDVPF